MRVGSDVESAVIGDRLAIAAHHLDGADHSRHHASNRTCRLAVWVLHAIAIGRNYSITMVMLLASPSGLAVAVAMLFPGAAVQSSIQSPFGPK